MPIIPVLLRSAPIVAQIVNSAPELAESAQKLYQTIRKRVRSADKESPTVEDEINDLRLRLDDSENNITSQAELSSQLATQLQALTDGLNVIHTRQNVILWVAGIALIISIVSVVLVVI